MEQMGFAGTEIFSDDLGSSVRTQYNNLLEVGIDGAEAERLMLDYYSAYLCGDDVDEPVFWFALALAESRKGRLSAHAKSRAMYFLDHGGDLERWNTPGNEKNYQKRIKVVERLRETLMGPQPERKKIRKRTVHHCPWPVGSLLAYQITNSEQLRGTPMWGKYMLLRIVELRKSPVSKIVPEARYSDQMIVSLYGWCGDEIPSPEITKGLKFISFEEPAPLLRHSPAVDRYAEHMRRLVPEDVMQEFDRWFEVRLEMCADLDWIPSRRERAAISCLGIDPNDAVDLSLFQTDILSVSMYGLTAMDLWLAKRGEKYLKR